MTAAADIFYYDTNIHVTTHKEAKRMAFMEGTQQPMDTKGGLRGSSPPSTSLATKATASPATNAISFSAGKELSP